MSSDDAAIGFDSPAPRSTMPYSVSMPQIFRIATRHPTACRSGTAAVASTGPRTARGTGRWRPARWPDRRSGLGRRRLLDERAHVDDALALLARDLRPVVRVGRVGQVLVLLVLLVDRLDEVLRCGCPGRPSADEPLDGQLLGPAHDVLDHGARREVLEVHDLLVAVLVGDLEELVGLVVAVHLVDGASRSSPARPCRGRRRRASRPRRRRAAGRR